MFFEHSGTNVNKVFRTASEALNKLKWKTLARRRTEHRATFIFKCLNNLFSHRFNIQFNKDKQDYNTRCKTISVRVYLVGIGGIGLQQILPQTIGIN